MRDLYKKGKEVAEIHRYILNRMRRSQWKKAYAQGDQGDNNFIEVRNESKIVKTKEVAAALEEMMQQQIKETELNQSSELNLQSPTVEKKWNNKWNETINEMKTKLTKVDGSRGIKDRSTSMYSHM